MNKPSIFVLSQVPVIGEIAEQSVYKTKILCLKCGMKSPIGYYEKVSYRLDFWDGEDIFQGYHLYIVSERLQDALLEKGIQGVTFEKIEILKGDYFEMGSQSWSGSLPSFYQLIINQRAKGPEIWWQYLPCEQCEKSKWDITEAGILALSAPFNIKPIPVRSVYYDSWGGEDVFYLEDPAMPIVTERFVNILKQFNGEVHLLESAWI